MSGAGKPARLCSIPDSVLAEQATKACWSNAINDAFALCAQIKNPALKLKKCQYIRVWNGTRTLSGDDEWELCLSFEPRPYDDGSEVREFLTARGNQRTKQLAGKLNECRKYPREFTGDVEEILKVQCDELKKFNDDFQIGSAMMGDLGKIFAYFKAEIMKNK